MADLAIKRQLHTWNSIARTIEKPDRTIFNLDQGEGTSGEHIQEAASVVRAMRGTRSSESMKRSGYER